MIIDVQSQSLLSGRKGFVVGIAKVEIDDVGSLCAFLVSDAALGITGDDHYVDGGFHILA